MERTTTQVIGSAEIEIVRRVARRRFGGVNRVDLEDLVQEALLALVREAGRWQPGSGTWEGWVAVTAERRMIDRWRTWRVGRGTAREHRRRFADMASIDAPVTGAEGPATMAERVVDLRAESALRAVEDNDFLAGTLGRAGHDRRPGRQLTRADREVVSSILSGERPTEMAERLGITPSAVSVRRRQALHKLRLAAA